MTPRLSTSELRNKTRLPQDALNLISESFREGYPQFFEGKTVHSEGFIYLDEMILQVGFREKGSIRQFNFETSQDYSAESPESVMDKIYDAIDAIQNMLEEYIEVEGDIEFPFEWKPFTFGDKQVFVRVSSENPDLEAEANKLLGEDEESSVKSAQLGEDFVDELFAKLRALRANNEGSSTH